MTSFGTTQPVLSLEHVSKSFGAVHPHFPALTGILDDAADFASCCGPVSCSAPLQTRPLGHAWGLRDRGPLAPPRAALAPAG